MITFGFFHPSRALFASASMDGLGTTAWRRLSAMYLLQMTRVSCWVYPSKVVAASLARERDRSAEKDNHQSLDVSVCDVNILYA